MPKKLKPPTYVQMAQDPKKQKGRIMSKGLR
jgi:hypothetical protein